jgi:selenocysteine lyase/cysteine desulfurase
MSAPDNLSRRRFISVAGVAPLSFGLLDHLADQAFEAPSSDTEAVRLPCPGLFSVKGTYLNAAYTHPMSRASAEAVKEYLDFRQANGNSRPDFRTGWDEVKKMYAGLINADPGEIAWIPGTMAGENMIVNGLGIPGSKARIVTDALHFDGSLYMYSELARQGADVHVITPRNNRIWPDQIEAAITPGTRLVAVSLVSMVNGFTHDLKSLCEIAHSRGALVYADIVQAVGAVLLDVHDSKVDFCAASSFKWLMGDFGAGFLYVSKESMHHVKRAQYGYRQLADSVSHMLPFDPPGGEPYTYSQTNDAAGHFEVGSLGNEAVATLGKSLELIRELGPAAITEHRKPMIRLLQSRLPSMGFLPLTPEDSSSPIVSFAYRDAGKKLAGKLADAKINIQLYDNRFRISPSVYNSISDIEKLIDLLSVKH